MSGKLLWILPLLALLCASGTVVAQPTALVDAAAAQIGITTSYDGRYQRLAYPDGDVAISTGVCTDVLIRAYRTQDIDLQVRVHEDMRRHFAAYPRLWGLHAPDRNIDHRRVPNLQVYFSRHGETLPSSRDPGDYRAGDIVTWRLASGLPHIGIVSSRQRAGRPRVIHNIGAGVREEDALFAFDVTGHYRYPR